MADSSRIFNAFSSEWRIVPDPGQPATACLIDYQIEMEFANALYSAVTSQFFNLLCSSIDTQFSVRCAEITKDGLYADEFITVDDEDTSSVDGHQNNSSLGHSDGTYRGGGRHAKSRLMEDKIWQFQASSDVAKS